MVIKPVYCLGDLVVGDGGKVALLGEVLPDEPVGVLV